ncbi:MAG TPA: AAA family ATPase [Candidatus Methanoperedens sp.]|nr:AAA family ATPase [Candidatus Methanoperedens sp.]
MAPDDRLKAAIDAVNLLVRGKEGVVRLAVACLLARGHLLLEDLPGVGKTTLALALARVLGLEFGRVQFTADLLPTDIVGVSVLDVGAGSLTFRPGPVFHQLVLADEINRATPKTQSALLEAMAEGQVSVEGRTHPLPQPFFVIATQNPVEHYGTYPLPESQLDRFMMTLRMGYPGREAERVLLGNLDTRERVDRTSAVLAPGDVAALQQRAAAVAVAPPLLEYVLDLAAASRESPRLLIGVSPRGAEHWVRAAKAAALLAGREYCVPEDIQGVAEAVIAHRVLPRGEFEKLDRASLVRDLLRAIPVR